MAASVVGICNQALGRFGHSQAIASIDEQSEAAAICKIYFEQVRDELLAMHPWWFASRRQSLALVAEYPNDDWKYAYRRPSGALTIRAVQVGTSRRAKPIVWEPGGDDAGGLIFCDEAEAGAQFIAQVTNPATWTPLFCAALSWRLAMDIGPVLAEGMGDVERMRRGFDLAWSAATAQAANEGVPDEPMDADAILARA